MTPDDLITLFTGELVPLVGKLFLLVIIFLYGIFAAVVLRQIQLMNKVVTEVNFSAVLFTIALLHLGALLVIFVLTVVLV